MKTPRIAIAGFQHETNTFAPIRTTLEDFRKPGSWPGLTAGDDVIEVFRDLKIPIGGFISAAQDWDLVPILWANAEPGSYVARSAFEDISAMICDGIRSAGDIDGIYLDLHGAMVTDDFEDGEGELLRRVRETVGNDLPIAVSLDLHGNVTAQMVDHASSITIYRTYPHIDMAETGLRAKLLLERELATGTRLKSAYRQADYLVPLQAQSTMREPAGNLYGKLDELITDSVVSADLALGFPPADIRDVCVSVVAYATSQSEADTTVDRMLLEVAQAESAFHNPLVPASEAVRQAMKLSQTATRPVVIADPQDNPGAGATGDTTGLLRALVHEGARDAVLGILWDPHAASTAHAAGVGAEFEVELGGRYRETGDAPFKARVHVMQLSDGAFVATGPMYGGSPARLGSCARLKIIDDNSDVEVVVGSVRGQNADQANFTHIGVVPAEKSIVAVKSTIHFMADYEPIACAVLFANAAGANPCQIDQIAYTRLRSGVRLGPNGPAFDPK